MKCDACDWTPITTHVKEYVTICRETNKVLRRENENLIGSTLVIRHKPMILGEHQLQFVNREVHHVELDPVESWAQIMLWHSKCWSRNRWS